MKATKISFIRLTLTFVGLLGSDRLLHTADVTFVAILFEQSYGDDNRHVEPHKGLTFSRYHDMQQQQSL